MGKKGAIINFEEGVFGNAGTPLTKDNIIVFADNESQGAPVSHTHEIADVTGLQGELDNKVDDSQVLTNVPAGAVFTDTVYTHPTQTVIDTGTLTGAVVISRIAVDDKGHTTVVSERTITAAEIGAALSSHTHNASDINAGTLSISRIPTGTTSSTVALGNHTHSYDNYNGWDLLVNGAGADRITSGEDVDFVAGANITIDRTGNTLTFTAATGTGGDGNNYTTGISFGTTDGVITLTRNGLAALTVDIDGRYELAFSKNSAFNKNFAGSGVATTVSRSDHNHSGVYATASHNHDGVYAPVEGTANVSASRDLTAADNGKTLICTNTITLTIPSGLGTNFSCNVLSDNTGGQVITIVDSGVTLKAPHGTKLLAGYTCNIGKRTGIETFDIQGELTT